MGQLISIRKTRVKKIQLEAARIATGTTKLISITALLDGSHLNREDKPTN